MPAIQFRKIFSSHCIATWMQIMAMCMLSFAVATGGSQSTAGRTHSTCQGQSNVKEFHCDPQTRLAHGPLTSRAERQFSGQPVREFTEQLVWPAHPGASAIPPPEYLAVVGAGKQAIPFLISLLSSEDVIINAAASAALGDITNKTFAAYSNDFGPHRDPQRWQNVISKYQDWWNEHKAESQVKWLIEDLTEPRLNFRRSAIQRLGTLGDPSAIPALRKLLDDRSVRLEVAVALAELSDHAAIPALISDFLTDDSISGRHQGICLLQRLTGQTMGFDPEADQASRTAAIERWKEWRSKHESP